MLKRCNPDVGYLAPDVFESYACWRRVKNEPPRRLTVEPVAVRKP